MPLIEKGVIKMLNDNSKTMSLDEELKTLLLCYQHEEVSFYKDIVNAVDVYQAENMVTCNVIIKEEGSDG